MAPPVKRPRTPSPGPSLLTPPPTGGSVKRVRFANIDLGDSNPAEHNVFNDTEATSLLSSGTSSPSSDISDKHRHVTIITPATVTTPFPFMKLPLSVRNKVYHHLLVVPAILCVRQKLIKSYEIKRATLYVECRQLLPGIAYGLAQTTVDAFKVHFSRFSTTNINILRVSSQLHAEAKTVFYSDNIFEIINPTNHLATPPDFSVRLFPVDCQHLVTNLNIRVQNFYGLDWLLNDGHTAIKAHCRGLQTLILLLEPQFTPKGLGTTYARNEHEKWTAYLHRLHALVSRDLSRGCKKTRNKTTRPISIWIHLRVLFSGEAYHADCEAALCSKELSPSEQRTRHDLRQALCETWDSFKRGGSEVGSHSL